MQTTIPPLNFIIVSKNQEQINADNNTDAKLRTTSIKRDQVHRGGPGSGPLRWSFSLTRTFLKTSSDIIAIWSLG